MPIETWMGIVFDQVKKHIVDKKIPIEGWQVRNATYTPEAYLYEDDFKAIAEGDLWGGPDVTSIFKAAFEVPDELEGQRLWFNMLTAGEVMVCDNGRYLNGIDPNRQFFLLEEQGEAGKTYEFMLEAYTRSRPDDNRNTDVSRDLVGCMQYFNTPAIAVINDEMLGLHFDLKAVYEAAYAEQMSSDIKEYLQYHLEELLKLFPLYGSDRDTFLKAVGPIRSYIKDKIFNSGTHFGKSGNVALVANSHLDIGYHWTVGQTVQKNARTTLIQLELMDRFPEFKYAHTQAWTYESLEEYYPELFERVKEKVASGQWEIIGGMYVEPDCNLPNAESFVRQIMYAKHYFKEKFDVDVDNAWLPDVFGNSPIMPQIMKSGGLDYYVTHKLSVWNDTNLFPHNMFMWKGLDGTGVNTCLPPIHFVTWMDTDETIRNWREFKNKPICNETLQVYGYGDGGSGVTDEMIEIFKRQQKLPGIPYQRLTTAKDYLHNAFDGVSEDNLPVWDGDLYLETHRGTFTTKGILKKYNRQGEFHGLQTDLVAAMSEIFAGHRIKESRLRSPWKKLLLNQFHDVLPGSHTHPVGVDATETYREMMDEYDAIQEDCIEVLSREVGEDSYVLINPFTSDTDRTVCFDSDNWSDVYNALSDDDHQTTPIQMIQRPDGTKSYVGVMKHIPALSLSNATAASVKVTDSHDFSVTETGMENRYYRMVLDGEGRIASLYDKSNGCEISAKNGGLNEWQMFEDKPGALNAWDIITAYRNQPIDIDGWHNITVVEDGPVTKAIRLEKTFGNSKAVQVIRMYHNLPRVDFDTWVDWQEEEKLLKVAFPVNVRARHYTVDTSAGGFERQTHRNTSWEEAQYEVPCHKWVDLSEGGFGVSLMNDSKYGCDVENNVMRLTLLRASIAPERFADTGEHRFTYSLFSHDGDHIRSGMTELAYDLNHPVKIIQGRKMEKTVVPIHIDKPALKVQSLKLSEDGSGDIILRLVEVYGSRGTATVKMNFGAIEVQLCDILEEKLEPVRISKQAFDVSYRPYEIISLRIRRPRKR